MGSIFRVDNLTIKATYVYGNVTGDTFIDRIGIIEGGNVGNNNFASKMTRISS